MCGSGKEQAIEITVDMDSVLVLYGRCTLLRSAASGCWPTRKQLTTTDYEGVYYG